MRKLTILCMLIVALLVLFAGCANGVSQDRYDLLQERYDSDLGAAQSQITALEDECSELETQIAEAQDTQASVEAQLTAITTTYQQLQASQNELSADYHALQTEHDTLTADYSSLEAQHTSLSVDYDTLQGDFDTLSTDHSSLETQYDGLCMDYDTLQAEYDTLQAEHETLGTDYSALETSYNGLSAEYDTLSTTYDSLEVSYNQLSTLHEASEALRIGHLLADYYDEVREGYSDVLDGFYWWLFTYQDQVDYAADIAKHGLGQLYWPDYEDNYYNLAGEYSYVTAHNLLVGVLNAIGVEGSDTPVQKIEKILGFINAHIHYEYDYNNAYLAPMETLGFRSGDCDDYAILAAALFEAVGIDAAIEFVNYGSDYHAMVLVHLDDIFPYLCYWYADLTSFGLQAGTWLIIEPQFTVDNQAADWVGQWNLVVAAEV